MSRTIFNKGDKVQLTDGTMKGRVLRVFKTRCKVKWRDGTRSKVEKSIIRHLLHPETRQTFSRYGVKWDNDHVNFKFDAGGVHFYGWWRKASAKAFSIDIFAVWERKGPKGDELKDDFSVESLSYLDEDPRDNPKRLDSDIVVACNRWFSVKLNGSLSSLEDLLHLARTPTIRINRIESIDRIIMKLKEFRDISIRSGGTRTLTLTGDHPKDIPIHIAINVTQQAMILEGKPPAVGRGATYDGIEGKRGEKVRGKITVNVPDKSNVNALLKQLKESKDKAEQRKIRGILRRMGHRGGARKERSKDD